MHFAMLLPCETLMSAKQAINGVVNNQINKGLLPSLRVKTFSKIVEYLAKLLARAWLSHAL